MLDAMLTYPEGLIDRTGTHIAIAAALSRLRAAEDRAGIDAVIRMLWQIAVNVEEGTSGDAKAELEALRKELQRALRDGAPPERIAELTQKLREALDRYMQSLMEEAQKRMAEGQMNQNQQMQPQGKMVTPQDLQKMLDMIEKLAQSGANEAAEEMLSQLEEILRNLQPGMPQQGQMQEGPLSEMLDKLSELMRQQQKLMDETQRMPQDGMGEDQQQGQQGEQGEQGQQGMGSLGDRQKGLSQMLQELMEQLGQNGMDAPRSFGEAGKSMQGAEGSLREGDRDQALGNQGDAMAKLREGAQGLARQMMQQGQGQQGNQGRTGEARGDDRDPLGRPTRATARTMVRSGTCCRRNSPFSGHAKSWRCCAHARGNRGCRESSGTISTGCCADFTEGACPPLPASACPQSPPSGHFAVRSCQCGARLAERYPR